MATPETIWSTPNVTVATACTAPPMSPPTIPPTSPSQGLPEKYANAAPNQVPRIIMPSRPMLTTPERSDHSPPRPASAIGTASSIGRPERAARGQPVFTAQRADQREHDEAGQHAEPDTGRGRAAPLPGLLDRCGTGRAGQGRVDERHAVAPLVRLGAPPSEGGAGGGAVVASARPTRRCCGPQRDAAHDLVGDDDRQHDDALGDLHDLLRDPVEVAGSSPTGPGTTTAGRRTRCRPGCCGRAGRSRCR